MHITLKVRSRKFIILIAKNQYEPDKRIFGCQLQIKIERKHFRQVLIFTYNSRRHPHL